MNNTTPSNRGLFSLVTLLALAGCTMAMPPGGFAALPGGPAPVAAGGEVEAPEASRCVTSTPCTWNSDCPNGMHCNGSMRVCFDPDPVASSLARCESVSCVWDSDCPSSWGCNSASHRCFLR